MSGIGSNGTTNTNGFAPIPVAVPPTKVLTQRIEQRIHYLGDDHRMHTLVLRDLYSVDDVTINMGKAFLHSLIVGRGYDRVETPRKLRKVMVRTNLVF